MSRILRRPMFRGGPVSSYGTGIASGLADGGRVNYAGGGQIGGGYIYGEPMADGRYGFAAPTKHKIKTKALPQPKTLFPWDLGAPKKVGFSGSYLHGVEGPMWTGADIMNFIHDNPKLGGADFYGALQGKWNEETKRWEAPKMKAHKYALEQTNNEELEKIMRNMMDPDLALMDPDKTTEENTTVETEEIWDDYYQENPDKKADEVDVDSGRGGDSASAASRIAGITETGDEEPVTKDTDLGIKEMADEYFELMGGKKARIQDASDYALQFFKSTIGEGKGMKEAAGDVADLALSKPSRTEAIQNWATKTAIVRKGQMDDLEARIKSSESVADKNILAAQWKQLNAQGQWEKKINTILADKYGGDESKRKAATMDALGQPASLGAALMAYEKAFGLGMKPNQMAFEGMVSEYYDPAPENWEDNANVSGTYYIPNTMVVVVIEKGKLKNQKDYSK